MDMTVAIIVVWALVVLLPFAVAVPMMFRARTALRIADGRFLLAFSGLLAASATSAVTAVSEYPPSYQEFLITRARASREAMHWQGCAGDDEPLFKRVLV